MDLSAAQRIVIVGGGQAAAQAIQSLRQGGYGGALTLIGEEEALPYQRPPLSKAYMKGEFDRERLYFRPREWYSENAVDLRLGQRADRIDRETRSVHIAGGTSAAYDALILATGSRPRQLTCEGSGLAGVFDLRTLSDVDAIRPEMQPGRRIIIIGAGYIGLEAAAVARQMGLDVTVVEMAPRVLARVTSEVISAFYTAEHTRAGVTVLTGTGVASLGGRDGHVRTVHLTDGRSLEADLVLAGIGILPNDELARDAGLECDNGIVTDRDARTSDPRIFAAGDCASRPLVHYDRTGRLESVHNAIEQAKLAAAAILGQPRPAEDCPWFWSDQYDLKLQIAGLSQGHDQIVLRGDPATRRFAAFYLREGVLISVDAVNSPPEFLASKKLIMSGARIAPEKLSDTSIPMKDIAASAA